MIQKETIKFNKPVDQNDIRAVESLIYPIFSKKIKKINTIGRKSGPYYYLP